MDLLFFYTMTSFCCIFLINREEILYEVGQILYLLINKSQKVAPVQVVEQVVRKSVSGEDISYTVQLPNNEKSKVPLSNIDCEIFTSSDTIRRSMISNATSAIDKIVSDSIAISSKVFSVKERAVKNNNVISLSGSEAIEADESKVTVDLGNGIVGKIDIASLEV